MPGSYQTRNESNRLLGSPASCQTSKTRVRARLDIRTGRLARTASRRARTVRAKCSLAGLTTQQAPPSGLIAGTYHARMARRAQHLRCSLM